MNEIKAKFHFISSFMQPAFVTQPQMDERRMKSVGGRRERQDAMEEEEG